MQTGGRCALCKKYLLEGDLTALPLFLGEMAHMVGQQNTAASPRGKAALPAADRDLADNLFPCVRTGDRAPEVSIRRGDCRRARRAPVGGRVVL